jgi:hypothetical protein
MTLDAEVTKLRWKTTEKVNKRLSYYGLSVTVFPNWRGGWSACVKHGDAPPTFLNRPTEEAAHVAAEQEFIRLKASGKFGPPPWPTTSEILRGVNSLDELSRQAREEYVELTCLLIREGERADLIQIDGSTGSSEAYWIPHSQHRVTRFHDAGYQTIIATKWWWNRAEPAEGVW